MSDRAAPGLDDLRDSARKALLAGQFDVALERARQALTLDPDDVACLELVGVAYCQSQRPAKGVRYLRRVAESANASAAARINLANALLSTGQPLEARGWLERALEADPDNADALTLLATLARQEGNTGAAEQHLTQALQASPAHPAALNALATQYAHSGRQGQALDLFRRAVTAQPDSAPLRLNLARTLQQSGRLEEAEEALRQTLGLEPEMVEAHLLLAAVLQAKGAHTAALEFAEAACRLQPDNLQACYLYCDLLERTHQLDQAKASLSAGLTEHPNQVHLNLVMARCERRTKALEPALERLDRVQTEPMDDMTAQAIHAERGMILDTLGEIDRAFAAFTRSNQHGKTVWQQIKTGQAPFLDSVMRLQTRFSQEWVESWTPLRPPGKNSPVFLLGFPRSGTTLLNRMLACHSRLQAAEEVDAINHLASILHTQFGGYPDALARLDDTTAARLRETYLRVFQDVAGIELASTDRLVDKMPINTVDVGLIHRLFPDANIIFVQRNPADVCLSCFMQPFQPNALNAQFLSLEDTAQCFRAVMDLWEHYQQMLPLKTHTVSYESLVDQPESTLRALCDFLSVGYESDMLNYRAQSADVKTASYQQVADALYTTAVGRAERYAKHLGPMAPWLESVANA